MKYISFSLIMMIGLIGCTENKKVEQYTVDFLVKDENKPILDNLINSCKSKAASVEDIKEVMSDPNCSNAEIALKKRQASFTDSSNTKRRESVRAFGEEEK